MDVDRPARESRLGNAGEADHATRTRSPYAVGVDAPAAEVRRIVGHRAMALTGDDRRRAAPGRAAGRRGGGGVDAAGGGAGTGLSPVAFLLLRRTAR